MTILSPYIWLIWDIITAIFIILCVHACARKGFIRTVINFLAYIIAAVAAKFFSPIAARYLYDLFISDAIKSALRHAVEHSIEESGGMHIVSLPKWMRGFYTPPLDNGDWIDAILAGVDNFVDYTIEDPAVALLSGICFLFLFSLLVFIIHRIARLFTAVYKIPVIGTVNTFLGGVLGIAQAIFWLLIAALAVKIAIQLTGGKLSWLNHDVLGDTFILRVFYDLLFPLDMI